MIDKLLNVQNILFHVDFYFEIYGKMLCDLHDPKM